MQRRYITVDVFTDRAFGGNPLAVVLDAGALSTAQMQAIASEFNYSETTFVLPPRDAANDAQVRIFTVRISEIPFAGHPNVGTAFVLATRAAKPPARLKFEEGAGLVPVEILQRGGQRGRRRTHRAAGSEQTDPIQRRAGGRLSVAVGGRYQDRPASAEIFSVGLPFLMVEVASREALRRAKPDAAAFARTLALRRQRCDLLLHARCAGDRAALRPAGADVLTRDRAALSEDPATGSATVAAAAMLADLSSEQNGEFKLRIGQGFDMGRPSLLLTRVRKANGAVASSHVGGACVAMMEGTFRLAGEG